jgi:hypothetical protein
MWLKLSSISRETAMVLRLSIASGPGSVHQTDQLSFFYPDNFNHFVNLRSPIGNECASPKSYEKGRYRATSIAKTHHSTQFCTTKGMFINQPDQE